jgi:hypothetical protein
LFGKIHTGTLDYRWYSLPTIHDLIDCYSKLTDKTTRAAANFVDFISQHVRVSAPPLKKDQQFIKPTHAHAPTWHARNDRKAGRQTNQTRPDQTRHNLTDTFGVRIIQPKDNDGELRLTRPQATLRSSAPKLVWALPHALVNVLAQLPTLRLLS